MRIGIIGLPNVGKSTLFNALTKQPSSAEGYGGHGRLAEVANYPFTTIDPNLGVVTVPDERLNKLTELSKSAKTVPTTIEFVDIAGLVKGAHDGEGLGNKFLSHIREVDAIVHVVRFFDDTNVLHVANRVNPTEDAEIIETELALADLDTIEHALPRAKDAAKTVQMSGKGDKEAVPRYEIMQKLEAHVREGKPARTLKLEADEWALVRDLHLLTSKPVLYLANVSDPSFAKATEGEESKLKEFTDKYSAPLALSVKIEQELVELSDEERKVFLSEYGLSDTGLNRLIQESYKILNLVTFFTTGEKESRAWTVENGSTAPQAAGKIHSDFERGFIRAETVAYADLIAAGSYAGARSTGKLRDEGKEYIVQDGDVLIFKFSV